METVRMETAMETHFMAKMGKWMTPEEEARQKFIMRERDRERKRIKRLNPEYRQMERERDRFRKLTPRPSVVIPDYPKLSSISFPCLETAELPPVNFNRCLTPEEELRLKMIQRERDRERKRIKRMNPEYRRLEQERDRDRKKARRANEAFRQLEKLRDKIRKDRKKGLLVGDPTQLPPEFAAMMPPVPVVKPELGVPPAPPQSQQLPTPLLQQQQQLQQHQQLPQQQQHQQPPPTHLQEQHLSHQLAHQRNRMMTSQLTQLATPPAHASHLQQLNKLQQLYPPRSFGHPALPIAGVTLMPQLCHPILHQNLSATLYAGPPNGIKQEYGQDISAMAAAQAAALASLRNPQQHHQDDSDMVINLEPEIVLQTGPEVNPAQPPPQQQHHFSAHQQQQHQQQQQQHHLQQQQHCNMFQHMAPQAHMQHMRSLPPPPPPPSLSLPPLPPPPPATHQQQQQQQPAPPQQLQHAPQ
ncbi:basic-leucine zipper transcription factor A isoform X5 [Drosophila suzukii]|uniref:Basic-leucine zipper transcription factor A isoform X5 n=1 Tax=Drosophila suzukii TaxID=28584 RepID=A0AB40A3P8_DROSZ|nr:putative mediator of RNA polymerase II transcription subunit 12 isoform X3 [Drosophila suzukii]